MKTLNQNNWHRLENKVLTLVLILSICSLKSQNLSELHLNIDTNRHLYLSLAPQLNGINYGYRYKIGSDTMFCTKSLFAQATITTTIIVDKKFKSFLDNEFIHGLNKIKIDLRHTSIEQSFVVSCIIFSGPLERWVSILDEYYLSQIFPLLVTFNSFLPPKEKFSLEFNKTIREKLAMGQFIDITIADNQEKDQLNNKRITMDFDKSIYTIRFYDTIEKKINYKPLNFNDNTLTLLKSATLKCVNSFSADKIKLKVTGPSSNTAWVLYQFPGIYIATKVKSNKNRTRNVYYDEYFNFLNSNLGKKYKLNY